MRPLIFLLAAVAPLFPAIAVDRPWTGDIIYFAMTDRFRDGDPGNNNPENCDPTLYDPSQADINRYLGGDLRGLETALESGYFNQLGVTALWLTPVVRNVWRSGYDLGGWKTGYHGYWAQDWLDIDPHLTSRTSLDGKPYADGPDGRMAHYRDFIRLAHSKGIKVIQDVVMNHAGPVFFYDQNGDGIFNHAGKDEWVQPFKSGGFHPNAAWGIVPRWNIQKTQPDGPRMLLGTKIPTSGVLARLDTYGRKGFSPDSLGKSDGEEVTCDFFSLRDLWTAPDSPHFDALVDEFVEIYFFYMNTVGVDGLRIDTVKHVHHEFWDAFTSRLRAKIRLRAPDKNPLVFGEVYDGNPARLGQYTWCSDAPDNSNPCMDSVLDFNTCFSAREYLRHAGGKHGSPAALEKAIASRGASDDKGQPFYNPNPAPDGFNSRQKAITFIENHDGLNRFRAQGITEARHQLAQALILALPGIPCLYYGAEFALPDPAGRIDGDGETGRLMYFKSSGVPDPVEVVASPVFKNLSRMISFRKASLELQTGSFLPLWVDNPDSQEDDGIFAFARAMTNGESYVVVVVNASDKLSKTGSAGHQAVLPTSLKTAGMTLKPALVLGPETAPELPGVKADGPLSLAAPPQSLVIYEAVATAGGAP